MNKSELVSYLNDLRHNKLPIYLQSEVAECGLMCLGMISSYYGNELSAASLRSKFNPSAEGVTLRKLMDYSNRLNLSCRALRVDLEDLPKLKTPCILHWDLDHFVVLKSVKKNFIEIHDPSVGYRKLSISESSLHFTGVVLEIFPTKEFKKKKESAKLKISDLWSNISGLKDSIIIILLFSILLQIFILAAPYYSQIIIDDVIVTENYSLLNILLISFILVLIFEAVTKKLRSLSLMNLSHQINLQLGANLFSHLVRLPISFFEKRHIGDIVSKFTSLGKVKNILAEGIIETIIDGFMAILTLAVIFTYDVILSTVVLFSVITYGVVRLAFYKPLREVSEREILAKAKEDTLFIEIVRGSQTLKLLCAESQKENEWLNSLAKTINEGIKLDRLTINFELCNKIIYGLENLLVIYIAANLILAGNFSVGMLVAFLVYKRLFIENITKLIERLIEYKMLGLHLERVSDIALTEKDHKGSSRKLKHNIQGELTVQNLFYSYSEEANASNYIFSDVNFSIKEGDSVAIYGSSGVGKTTLLKLLLGLHKPSSGSILIDGIPLDKLDIDYFRSQIGTVMQEDTLFSGTISDNIAFGDSSQNIEKIVKCSKLAQIHEEITKMPMGYNSLVGDMGSILSGGQKQRVLLARALYRNPKILFLDEATSHLDIETERKVSEAISNQKITRIIIAHRPETINSADRKIQLK